MQENLIKYKKKLQKILLEERQQWFLWIPVLYAAGVLVYLAIPYEPPVYAGIAAAVASFLAALFFRKRNLFLYISLMCFFVFAGFVGANIRALTVKAPVLEKDSFASLEGRIDEINTYKKGFRVFLTDIKSDAFPPDKTPKKIRLTVLTKIGDVKAGDIISVRASLTPPLKAVAPGTYDFSRDAYFQQIGAVGFTVSDFIKISGAQNNFHETISQARNIISNRLVNSVGGVEAEIAKALFIGDTGGIDSETMAAIRNSGLAHLLSISGLHLVIVCAIFFKISRMLLTIIPGVPLRFNTKKIAAICAIIGSYFYLLMSGSPVSAERSFLMSAMVFIAIIFDRSGLPLRIVAIAAMYLLITAPENITKPGFQMSFGAVIALISAFEWLSPHIRLYENTRKIPKIVTNITGTILSSIVATIATAPFAIYHFNRNSPYGVIANILAIPMASFGVMPFGVLAIILMPLNLEWLVAWPLRAGIDFIINIAQYVAALPYAGSTIPAISDWQLLIISFGFMWLVIWKTRWRLFGLVFIMIAVISVFFNKTPDIMINSEATLFAVKDENGELIVSSNISSRYARSIWVSRAGQVDAESISKSESKVILCDAAGCIYKKNGYITAFIKHPAALERDCGNSDIIINLTGMKYNCIHALKQINIYDLKKKGAHEIYLGDKVIIKMVSSGRDRVWE